MIRKATVEDLSRIAEIQIFNYRLYFYPLFKADSHYKEGIGFHTFMFEDKKFAVGLCGDLWDDENVEQMKRLNADVILWPIYTDFNYEEWNKTIKHEYAEQATPFI